MADWGTATEGYNEAETEIKETIFNVRVNIFICFISLFIDISFTFYFTTETLWGLFKREIKSLLLWVAKINLFKLKTFSADFLKALRIYSFFININMKS